MENSQAATLAILAPYPFVPAKSGGHKAVSAYVRYISAARPTICICSEGNAALPGVELIPLFPDHPSKYFDPRVGWRIRRVLRQRKIKYLGLQHHYHGLLLMPFLWGLGIKTFVFSHNIEFERWRSMDRWWWPLMKGTEQLVYYWAKAVFFISWHEAQRAPKLFRLAPEKCYYAPYPIDQSTSPPYEDALRQTINDRHGFAKDEKLLLFFGPQSYLPNLEAVKHIVYRIHPLLKVISPFQYRILICGGGLPDRYERFADLAEEGVHYLGFVEDIETYVQAADIILNPVNIGGGVKTKLVEAIAMGKTVVSSKTGALGVQAASFGSKLIQVKDTKWEAQAEAIVAAMEDALQPTPASFYEEHYGPRAVQPILSWLSKMEDLYYA
ncbi:MAG: glycosyltransferase family 4 protein [Bacteroidota bacterium]